ncbi:MAG: efflux RND transporter periplasmic adaptor subunit, partial [Bacteroidota bacterium]
MKKFFQHINLPQAGLFLVLGLLFGWIFFGTKSAPAEETDHDHDHVHATAAGESVYTCSMHPQIRQGEPGQCPLCGMDLTPAAAGGGQLEPVRLEMSPEAVALARIQTSKVEAGGQLPTKPIDLNGTVRMDESRLFSQVSHLAGRVERLYLNTTGARIYQGQKIAKVYAPELVAAQKELLEAISLQRTMPELYEAAKEKLRQWKLSDEQILEVERSAKLIQNVDIFAENSGVVMQRKVSVGDYVKAGQVLFEAANLRRLWVEFEAYEQDLGFLKVGDQITFSLEGKSYARPITYIDPAIGARTRVAKVRVEISNPTGKLRPEMLVRGQALAKAVASPESQLVIPRTAVMWTGKQSLVYVKVPDRDIPTFEARKVDLGESLGDQYQILAGLVAGEEVVTYGTFTVDAAAQLNNRYSMMNQDIEIGPAQEEEKEAMPQEELPSFVEEVKRADQEQLDGLYAAYFQFKDFLVQADSVQAKSALASLGSTLEALSFGNLSEEAKAAWTQAQQQMGTVIADAQTESLATQRVALEPLSMELIRVVKMFGVGTGEKLYVQFCPMAFNDKGAAWLSNDSDIFNPYFGDLMLSCGWVE